MNNKQTDFMRTTFLERTRRAFGQLDFITRWHHAFTLAALVLTTATLPAAPTVNWLSGGPSSKYPSGAGFVDGDITLSAEYHTPCGLAIDSTGNFLFVADRDNNAVRELEFDQNFTYELVGEDQNGKAVTNLFNKPVGVALDNSDSFLFVLNRGNGSNGSVLEFNYVDGLITTNLTKIINAGGIALDPSGDFFVTASNQVFKVAPNGVSNVVATVTASGASLQGIVYKRNGLLAVCDTGRNGILLINPTTGVVTTNAGFHGAGDFFSANNTASSNTARFFQPAGVAEAGDGTLIVSDYGNGRVKAVLPNGSVTNIYGVTSNDWVNPYKGFADGTVVIPDQVGGVAARLPNGVVMSANGTVYVTEDYYHIIRQITGTGLPLPPPPPPAAPLGLTATATFGQVSLTWSASIGATNYNIKRSTSSGSEVTIASTAGTSYTDTSVLDGTTYFYVVSALNSGGEGPNSLEVSATPPIPPPPAPNIGWFDYEGNDFTGFFTVNHPVSGAKTFTAHNDISIAIDPTTNGIQTYYIYTNGPQPVLAVPSSTNGSSPPFYQDGLAFAQPLPVTTMPDLVIKAVNVGPGGSSAVTTAEFLFQVDNPIVNGVNAALFTVSDVTSNVVFWYTTDGTTPTNAPPSIGPITVTTNNNNSALISLNGNSNILFKVRAFRKGYSPSGIAVQSFSPGNFIANQISFGLASGEPASKFEARPGQFFYAPVTLSLIDPSDTMYSLQFNAVVTNGLTTPNKIVNGAGIDFFPMLMTKVPLGEGDHFPPSDGNWYLGIPSVTFTSVATNSPVSGTFVDTNNNLIGVSWMFRTGFIYFLTDTNGVTILDFDTAKQDLITYSIDHDTLFKKADGLVVLGAYSFLIPTNANTGDQYFIQLGSASATRDGAGATGAGIYIQPPVNSQAVTVTNVSYLVGDAAPFHWLNVGDFGDGMLDSSDVQQVFQSAVMGVDMPPANSDLFLAMDSSGSMGVLDGVNGYYTNSGVNLTLAQQQALFNGSDLTINSDAFGDGQLDVSDVYVTFRRSEDHSLNWWLRYWTNGQFVATQTPNLATNTLTSSVVASSGSSKTTTPTTLGSAFTDQTSASQLPFVSFSAGDAVVNQGQGQTIQIPVNANIFGIAPLRILGLNITVHPLDGSPALTTPIQFIPAAAGQPQMAVNQSPANYSAAWWPTSPIQTNTPGLNGNVILGTLYVTIPTNATSLSAYAVHFDKASASPNGGISFPKSTYTGLITLSSRTNSSYGDGIPDSWRLRWFGTIYDLLSVSNACPSGDGVRNWNKYVAGVDPNAANDFPSVNAKSPVPSGSTMAIHWPTVINKQYVILRSPTLFPGNWTAIATNTGTGTDMEFDDSSSGKANYYRVLILP